MIQQNGLTLAYIGDAYYELLVRKHLIDKKITKVKNLHEAAIKYTSSVNQAKAARVLIEEVYTEDELLIFKRGRNQNASHKPKNTDIATYNTSTGFEAVIGYHFLNNDLERINKIMDEVKKILE
ncbi:MAG: ribonuclease III [Tenericutes bacterium]|nr:ribonuclease III [Mycoplasmatota bacterium]